MKDNPFLSDTFAKILLLHFNRNKPVFTFNFLNGPTFIKPTWLPVYMNAGKNHTKGVSYSVSDEGKDFGKKVLLIYDVPEFFKLDLARCPDGLGFRKTRQYPGFLVELYRYTDFTHYFSSNFSKSSRYKLTKYKKRLESCFEISYKMHYGEIDRDHYHTVFEAFRQLLEKRFMEKGTTNNNLDPKEWNFYKEVAYPMILEKKASLFVIYDQDRPIGITLNYFSEDTLFDAITVFDIDYEKFHLGSITIMKLIEWAIDRKMRYFDFSKGYFDYKKRWATREYDFEYHLYYDKRSFLARIISFGIANYYTLKKSLRERKWNEAFHKITFRLRGKARAQTARIPEVVYAEVTESYLATELRPIDYYDKANPYLKSAVFHFLYLNGEAQKDVTLYQIINAPSSYLIYGKNGQKKITFSL